MTTLFSMTTIKINCCQCECCVNGEKNHWLLFQRTKLQMNFSLVTTPTSHHLWNVVKVNCSGEKQWRKNSVTVSLERVKLNDLNVKLIASISYWIIYDIALRCKLFNESVKWQFYKNFLCHRLMVEWFLKKYFLCHFLFIFGILHVFTNCQPIKSINFNFCFNWYNFAEEIGILGDFYWDNYFIDKSRLYKH